MNQTTPKTDSAYSREEEAGAVAHRVPFTSLKTLDSNPLLQLITTTQYQWLVSFMTTRDERMQEIVSNYHEYIADDGTNPCTDESHSYSSTIVATLQAAFEADPCIQATEALRLVLSAPCTFMQCKDDCRYNAAGLWAYAEELLKDLVDMAQNLSWEDPHKEPQQQRY